MGTQLVELHGSALALDKQIKEIIYMARRSWVRLGIAVMRFHDAEYYKQLGMTFDEWGYSRLGKSKDTIYRIMNYVRALEKGITLEEIEKITKDNCEVLVKGVPEPKRFLPEIVKMAQEMSKPEFIECLKKDGLIWEPATEDDLCQIVIHCPNSISVLWEGALAKTGSKSNSGGLEILSRHYLTCGQVEEPCP